MLSTVQPRRVSATSLAVCVVVVASFLCFPSFAFARAEVKGSTEYQNVKEDFLCRACVSIGEVFFDEVLPPITARYQATLATSHSSLSAPSSPSNAASSGRPTSKLGHRQREELIVEVHEGIDALCGTVEKSIQRQSMEAVDVAADDVAARQLLSPLVFSTDLRDGVLTACPMALEEMNEALTDAAFKLLLPRSEKSSRSRHSRSTNKNSTTGAASDATAEDKAAVYELSAAGSFCEEVGLCSRFVHYHITSDSDVRRRAREAQKESSDTGVDGTSELGGSRPSNAALSQRGGSKQKSMGRKASSARAPKVKRGEKAKPLQYYADMSENEPPLLWTLRRALQLDTWRQLKDSLNTTEILSVEYWRRGLVMASSPEMRFHLQAYVPLATMYALLLAAVLLVVILAVAYLRRRRSSAQPTEANAREDLLTNTHAKKDQ